MDELLTPVSQTYKKSKAEDPFLEEPGEALRQHHGPTKTTETSSVEEAAEALKGEPDYDTLVSTLRFFARDKSPLSLSVPGPQSAQIVQLLVTDIASNYWGLLKDGPEDGSSDDSALFIKCLRSIAGVNSILARFRALTQEHKSAKVGYGRSDVALNIRILLDLICCLLDGDGTVLSIWKSTMSNVDSEAKKRPLSQELVVLLAGGRIISITAEADDILKGTPGQTDSPWVANGLEYSKWLGRNITSWARDCDYADIKPCAELFTRSLRLGYSGMCRLASGDISAN
jgi:telomere length regulation protein